MPIDPSVRGQSGYIRSQGGPYELKIERHVYGKLLDESLQDRLVITEERQRRSDVIGENGPVTGDRWRLVADLADRLVIGMGLHGPAEVFALRCGVGQQLAVMREVVPGLLDLLGELAGPPFAIARCAL